MITGATKNKVDDIWQRMWEGGVTNPIEVIMQLTYLMFMKSLDDKELEAENMEMLGMTAKACVPANGGRTGNPLEPVQGSSCGADV